jgi:hypothetical protein
VSPTLGAHRAIAGRDTYFFPNDTDFIPNEVRDLLNRYQTTAE